MNKQSNIFLKIIFAIALMSFAAAAFGQTTSFTYQGKLNDNHVSARDV